MVVLTEQLVTSSLIGAIPLLAGADTLSCLVSSLARFASP